MAADIRSFFRRLPGLFRNDFAAVMLVIANILPVVNILWKGEPILRAMPMWLALVVGAIVGSSFHSAAVVVLFVLPVKLAFDVLGHFHEHGMLAFDEVESEPVQS